MKSKHELLFYEAQRTATLSRDMSYFQTTFPFIWGGFASHARAFMHTPIPPRLWPIMNLQYNRSHYCRFMVGHSLKRMVTYWKCCPNWWSCVKKCRAVMCSFIYIYRKILKALPKLTGLCEKMGAGQASRTTSWMWSGRGTTGPRRPVTHTRWLGSCPVQCVWCWLYWLCWADLL